MRNFEFRVKRRSGRALDAVIRPQDLCAIGNLDSLERMLAGMGTGERSMSRRMPILRQDDVRVRGHQAVDRGDDRVAVWNG